MNRRGFFTAAAAAVIAPALPIPAPARQLVTRAEAKRLMFGFAYGGPQFGKSLSFQKWLDTPNRHRDIYQDLADRLNAGEISA